MFRLTLFLFICLSSVFALELKNLCEERAYLNNAVINSFIQLKLEKDLEPVSKYLSEDDPSNPVYEEILNQIYSNRLNLTEIVQKFQSLDPKPEPDALARSRRSPRQEEPDPFDENSQRVRFLSVTFPTYSTTTEPTITTTDAVEEAKMKLSRGYNIPLSVINENIRRSFAKFHVPMKRFWLRLNLERLEKNRISENWMPKDDLKLELESVNQELNELNETQISVFQNQILDAFYERPIAMLDGFTVERNQSVYLDDSAVGTMHFSLYIPSFHQNWKVDESCYNLSSLPAFYRTETLSSSFKNLSNSQFKEELEKVKNL